MWDASIFSTFTFLPHAYVVRREGNTFTLLVCPRGGYPYPIMLCNISQNAMGQWGGVPGQVPPPARLGWGGTLAGGGYPGRGGTLVRYPSGQVRMGGVPWSGGYPGRGGYPGQVPPQPGQDGGVPCWGGYPGRTTKGVLTTRRAVCLLRSRRRTFLW